MKSRSCAGRTCLPLLAALALAALSPAARAQGELPPGCADAKGNPRASLVVDNQSDYIVQIFVSSHSGPIGSSAFETIAPRQRRTLPHVLHVGVNDVTWNIVQGASTRRPEGAERTIRVPNAGAATCAAVHTVAVTDPGGSSGGTILVTAANYGLNCPHSNQDPRYPGRKDVTTFVAQACNGKRVCSYAVNHRVIGDPSYGCAKDMRIEYQCSGGPNKRATVPPEASGRVAHLEC